jgi:hypothetical protein
MISKYLFTEIVMSVENINCLRCKNYIVTWDSRFPRGCKIFGFKGAVMPSITVFKSTGIPCENFELKQTTGNKV